MAESKVFHIFIFILVLIFPLFSNLVSHSGSVVLVLLTLAGLPYCFSKKKSLHISNGEKAVMWAFVALFSVYLLSFVFNVFMGDFENPDSAHLDHKLRFLFIIPILLLFKNIKMEESILWYSVSAGAAISGIYAIINKFWLFSEVRITGSYHPIAFGDLSIVMAFMSIAGLNFFQKRGKFYAFIPITAFLLGMAASIFSGSKGAWIALPIFTLIIFLLLGKNLKIWPCVSIVLIAGLISFAVYQIPASGVATRINDMKKELTSYKAGNHNKTSIAERIEGWKAAWQIFKEHPVTGAGVGNFQPLVHEMIAKGKVSEIISRYSQPHSLYLYGMADCGIIGLLAIMGVFVVPLWVMLSSLKQGSSKRDVVYSGLILITGFMHFGLTESIFKRNIFIGFYVIMLAVVLASLHLSSRDK